MQEITIDHTEEFILNYKGILTNDNIETFIVSISDVKMVYYGQSLGFTVNEKPRVELELRATQIRTQ